MTALLTEGEWSALRLSAVVAAWALLASAVPGIALGWLLARRRFPGKALLDAFVHAPLVLPPVVTGYVLLALAVRLEDATGIDLAFTRAAAVIAAAIMGFPLLVRSVRLGIELVDRRLEDAARTLGASPWRVLLTVTLPLALPGIVTGFVLSFARSLGEFGATITFAGNVPGATRTLPLALYTFMQMPGDAARTSAARLVVISLVFSLAALLVSEILARRISRRLGSPP